MVLTSWRLPSKPELKICQINNWHTSVLFSLIHSPDILPPPSFSQSTFLKKSKLKRKSNRLKLLVRKILRYRLYLFKLFISSLNQIYLFISTGCKRTYLSKYLALCRCAMEAATWPDAFIRISSSMLNGRRRYL